MNYPLTPLDVCRELGLVLNAERRSNWLDRERAQGRIKYKQVGKGTGVRYVYEKDTSRLLPPGRIKPGIKPVQKRGLLTQRIDFCRVRQDIEDSFIMSCARFNVRGNYIGLIGERIAEHLPIARILGGSMTAYENSQTTLAKMKAQGQKGITIIHGDLTRNIPAGTRTCYVDADFCCTASLELYRGVRRILDAVKWEPISAFRVTVSRRCSHGRKDRSPDLYALIQDDLKMRGCKIVSADIRDYSSGVGSQMTTGQIIFKS